MTTIPRRRFLELLALVPALPWQRTIAATYPDRPIRMVVPFPPGGSVDQVARMVGQIMGTRLGQPIVVENKAGANAAIGISAVAHSPADGYTLLFGTDSGLVVGPLLAKKAAFDVDRDFVGIGAAANVPLVITVHPSLGITTLGGLIGYAKKNPRKLNYSSTGNGSVYHLATELLCQQAGIEMTHIPFTGGAPALNALIANQVNVLITAVGSPLQYIRAKKLVALAVLGSERVRALPDVPALQEAGVPGVNATSRYSILAPRQTPPHIVLQLIAALNRSLGDSALQARLTSEGFQLPASQSGNDVLRTMARDRGMWKQIIATRGISLE